MVAQTVVSLALPLIGLCIFLDYLFNNFCPEARKIGPIKRERMPNHPTREGFPGVDRWYIVAGGSGFVGSWIVRYLLLRGEKRVYIFDRRRPPADVIRHGAIFVDIELTGGVAVEKEMLRIYEQCGSDAYVIIYNCSCIRRYFAVKNVDLGLQAAENLVINAKLFPPDKYIIIHIGDAISHRTPVSFWKFWDRRHWTQQSRNDLAYMIPWASKDKDEAFSRYAWYQAAIESLVRSLSCASGCLRIEGFVTGHAGDSFLSPALAYGGALLHSWNVPISIINVEDVARAALALEYTLLDPKTRSSVSGSVYTIEGHVTTLSRIYEYIATKQSFRTIKISPVVVYLFSWVVTVFGFFLPVPPLHNRDMRKESILCGYPATITLSRFCTLQIAQLPNHHNHKRVLEVLKFRHNFPLAKTLDMVIEENKLLSKSGKRPRSNSQ